MADYSIPAPVGGWNSIEALDMMQSMDAIKLFNLIPRETSVESRKGCTGVILSGYDIFESLHTYNGSGGSQLLAIGQSSGNTDSDLYQIDTALNTATSLGTISTAKVGQNRWQSLNINDKIVFVCDGANAPQQWDGTTFTAVTISGIGTASDLSGVTSYKGRAIYWSEGSNSFWYAAAGAHAGLLTEFPIDFVTQRGGGIKEIVTWTRDSGDGMDDWLVILMNTGETIAYSGDAPDATNFTSNGRFQLGEPLSIRGSCNLASDRIIITRDGYINLSSALQQGRIAAVGNVGDKIVNSVKELIDLHANNYGWEINFFPSKSLLIINVPVDTETPNPTYKQHVMNTKTGSWCEFDGWQAVTFCEYENEVYFCTSEGEIFKAFSGTSDNGAFIDVECIPAFNNFGIATLKKQLSMCTIVSNYYLPQYFRVDGLQDFTIPEKTPLTYPFESDGTLWDVSFWDVPFWDDGVNGNGEIKPYPICVTGYGYSLSVRIRHATKKQVVKYYSFKLKFKQARTI